MILEKEINWDGYTKVFIRCIEKDGSYFCNLSNDDGSKVDTNISFPSNTTIFTLTEEEIASLDVSTCFVV